jgi:hypothetical protein
VASELMNSEDLSEFAKRCAEAWCSRKPESVAEFFAENGLPALHSFPAACVPLMVTGWLRKNIRTASVSEQPVTSSYIRKSNV